VPLIRYFMLRSRRWFQLPRSSSASLFCFPFVFFCSPHTQRSVPFTATVDDAIRILKNSNVSTLPIMHHDGVENSTISFSNLVALLVKLNFDKEPYLTANVCVAASFSDLLFVKSNATVKEAILLMEEKHIYEVGIIDPLTKNVQTIVSQSDIVRFIFTNRDVLLKDHGQTLKHLKDLGSSSVGTMSERASVKEACKMLLAKGVNAIALVDDKAIMRSCLSPESFAELTSQHWIDFSDPVGKFKVQGRDEGWVLANETLESVLTRIVASGAHRVWVLNDDGAPTRIITLTDIIHHFLVLNKV
jgi:CBS-domain-containing membrane protein